MAEERMIRLLRADEIECRVATVSEKGVSLLLYKDARVDQNILDETFGIFGWTRTHERIGDALFCSVSIKGKDGMWISKMDVGTESYADPVKGAASDAFKRACVNWGSGRELYSAPFIWIPALKLDIQREKEKWVVKDRFHVSKIIYEDGRAVISGVEIQNSRNEVVFTYGMNSQRADSGKKAVISAVQKKKLIREMERTGVTEDAICRRYYVDFIDSMDVNVYKRALEALGKTKDMAA